MPVLTPAPIAVSSSREAAPAEPTGPVCSLQRSGSLWQLGIEAQELTTAIGQLAGQLEADDEESRAQALAELETALLADEGNKAALAAKADATCWVIEHLRGQAAYRLRGQRPLATGVLAEQPGPLPSSHPFASIAMTVAAPSTNGTRPTSRPAAPRPIQRPPSALELIRSADRADDAPAPEPAPDSVPEAPQASPAGFSPEQLAALAAPLDRANVRQREQGRGKVAYVEGWFAVAEANRIFGFDGWQRQTIAVRCVAQAERPIGRDQKPGWGVTYTARVRVTVTAGGLTPLIREGSGAGHGIDVDLGQAHESALKEAETDAM